jgi:hypothetical protein
MLQKGPLPLADVRDSTTTKPLPGSRGGKGHGEGRDLKSGLATPVASHRRYVT